MNNTNMDFSFIKHIHFVGIKGIAMTALAVWVGECGIHVTGSDTNEEFPSDPILKSLHILPLIGFSANHVKQLRPDLVIYTGAHDGRENIEVVTAISMGIPTLPHGKALGLVMHGNKQISVAGSHGKTTTSAMIATILTSAGLDPSYAIGCGEVFGLGLPGHFGKGEYFVAEADEYVTDPTHDRTPRFLWQNPDLLVITNIDYDHPDAYASLGAVQDAFVALVTREKGVKITLVNADDIVSYPIINKKLNTHIITYGLSEFSDYRITSITFHPGKTTFLLLHDNVLIHKFTLFVPGEHNVHNAAAAVVTSLLIGVPIKEIAKGISKFRGAKRRFEAISVVNGVEYYDDYAHHPKEISSTLSAIRAWYPRNRLIAVFQPHTYSRTKSLLKDFGKAFTSADTVITTDIYASARESNSLGITGKLFSDEVKKHHSNVVYAPGSHDILSILTTLAKRGDRVVFMGAGNMYSWGKDIVARLKRDHE
jgi:UDP-N-acetylmuramate--alanine ligase